MVNEALPFSPTRQDSKKTLIFPVGAYANLSLIALEVWDSMLLVPSEQLVTLPAEHRAVQHCVKIPPTESLNSLQVVDELNDLGSTLANAVPPQIACTSRRIPCHRQGTLRCERLAAVSVGCAKHAQALSGRLGPVDTVQDLLAALDGHHHVR